ncbi:MAG: hypothetical protein HW412_1377 [Bacteroidetes bacterium]|nr:hypothetical protein [Bacteroidota bacterium]
MSDEIRFAERSRVRATQIRESKCKCAFQHPASMSQLVAGEHYIGERSLSFASGGICPLVERLVRNPAAVLAGMPLSSEALNCINKNSKNNTCASYRNEPKPSACNSSPPDVISSRWLAGIVPSISEIEIPSRVLTLPQLFQ